MADYSAERRVGWMVSELGEAISSDLPLLNDDAINNFSARLMLLSQRMKFEPKRTRSNTFPRYAENALEQVADSPHKPHEESLKIFTHLGNLQKDFLQQADKIPAQDFRKIHELTERFLAFVDDQARVRLVATTAARPSS